MRRARLRLKTGLFVCPSIPGLRQEVDISPTVLDGLGLEVENASFPGTSLFKATPPDRALFSSSSIYSHAIGMRRGGLKYIYNFGRTPTEVYAINRDPDERREISETLPRSALNDAGNGHAPVARASIAGLTGPRMAEPLERKFWSSTHEKAIRDRKSE